MATVTATIITTINNSQVQLSGGTQSFYNIIGEALNNPFFPTQITFRLEGTNTGHLYLKLVKRNYDGKEERETIIPNISEFNPNGKIAKIDLTKTEIKDFSLDGTNYLNFPILANETVLISVDYFQSDLKNLSKPITEKDLNIPQAEIIENKLDIKPKQTVVVKSRFSKTDKILTAILIVCGLFLILTNNEKEK